MEATQSDQPKKLVEQTKENLIKEAERIEREVHFYELDCAKKAGIDLGQATILRRLADEIKVEEKK